MKQKQLSTILRKIVDMLDNDECSEETLTNMAAMYAEDHQRIDRLTTAVTYLMEERLDEPHEEEKRAKIVSIDTSK